MPASVSSRSYYHITEDCIDRPGKDPKTARKPAIVFAGEVGNREAVWTYKDLAAHVDRATHALHAEGLRKNDRVILKLPNGPEFPPLFFGAMKAGVIPIPASPLLTEKETVFLKKDSGARRVFSSTEDAACLLSGRADDFLLKHPKKHSSRTRASDAAYWLYTSGTEGRPKAVIHGHGSVPAHDARSREWLGLKKNDVVLNTSALNWSYALTAGLTDVLRAGSTTVILTDRPEPKMILGAIQRHRVTVLMSVPGLYRILTEFLERFPREASKLRSLRTAVSAGEQLPDEIRRRFCLAAGLRIREGLGMTEHSIYLGQVRGEKIVPGSCGRPFSGHRIAILRKDGSRARDGEIGILASHRSCPGLLLRYRGRSPRASFLGPWFLSGDLAYRDQRGSFFYVGRRDDVITAGGYRISPMEVEAALNRHDAVSESAVIGEEISSGRTAIAAYIVPRGKRPFEAEGLIAFCRRHLAKYKVPKKILAVKSLPKTANGKIKRQDLRSRLETTP